ncbi:MAG TPA: class I SAM-dependent methyltransferase [Chitinophagaceae bacterium]|nr:class I SAM-dependent methyltransferase [Chitinophagaceae bacterium]
MSKTIHTAQQYWDVRSELFANYYKKPSWFDKMFRRAVYTRTAVMLNTIKECGKCTVLDIGSGPGVNSVTWLKNTEITFLMGIDFSENMNEYANKNALTEGVANRCKFVEGDFLTYDFKGDKFDVACAAGVTDYVKDTKALVKKMDAVTNKAFVASWPKGGLRMTLRRSRYTCPLYQYNEADVRRLHEGLNLKSLDIIHMQGGIMSVARK